MEEYHWTTGKIRPISFYLKAESGLVQIDFSLSGVHQFRAVMDRSEFESFVSGLSEIRFRLSLNKLAPGELDPRD